MLSSLSFENSSLIALTDRPRRSIVAHHFFFLRIVTHRLTSIVIALSTLYSPYAEDYSCSSRSRHRFVWQPRVEALVISFPQHKSRKSHRWYYPADIGASQILGGAEQLIVSIGCSLKKMGHDVTIITSHHDHNHCFDETKKNGKDCIVTLI